jgi:predicted RNase H-like nuclease (RuvC/YqgF family)
MTSARIFILGLGQVIAAELVNGERVNVVGGGQWTQERYQRRLGNARIDHSKEVVERLVQIVCEDKITHIVLAGERV